MGGQQTAVMNERIWTRWPLCPSCGKRRQTVCPVCGVAGDGFPLAEYLAPAEPVRDSRNSVCDQNEVGEEPREILLICAQCDEAFPPSFYRFCAQCGYDSVEGIEIPRADVEQISDRVLWAITGLIVVATAVMVYFWLLL